MDVSGRRGRCKPEETSQNCSGKAARLESSRMLIQFPKTGNLAAVWGPAKRESAIVAPMLDEPMEMEMMPISHSVDRVMVAAEWSYRRRIIWCYW